MLRTVLSRTPTWAAGVAGGLFTTLQQLGLGLGVALPGGVFHAAASATTGGPAAGHPHGFAVAVTVQAVLALAFAFLATRVARAGAGGPDMIPTRPEPGSTALIKMVDSASRYGADPPDP
ncbi:hypothetical protein PV394_19215 [Streptomyces sp. NE06-03E]|uniref:hypothetical protein n=2 Tax=unclassified Streptomyces TaxID=2593676 RepID=UPI0029BBA00F|nr:MULTISPECIES: hypothetical protein [unclassified Streptomyces]MDX3057250.1 hypothetical protein [Streptomyces sp. NE06-03E]